MCKNFFELLDTLILFFCVSDSVFALFEYFLLFYLLLIHCV